MDFCEFQAILVYTEKLLFQKKKSKPNQTTHKNSNKKQTQTNKQTKDLSGKEQRDGQNMRINLGEKLHN